MRQHRSNGVAHDADKRTVDGKLLSPKQIRARMRRRAARGGTVSQAEVEALYHKPIDEWTLEELAHGRPKSPAGGFRGPRPKWVTAEIHEMAMDKYRAAIKGEMQALTLPAVELINEMLTSNDVDDRGKPIVPASTKLDAAKFLLEHVVGKPTQRIESDVSVKLQGILGQVMVNPTDTQELAPYQLAHYPGLTMNMGVADDDDAIDAEEG